MQEADPGGGKRACQARGLRARPHSRPPRHQVPQVRIQFELIGSVLIILSVHLLQL